MHRSTLAAAIAFALLAVPAHADTSAPTAPAREMSHSPATSDAAAILAEAGPGTRWGLVIADPNGEEIVTIDPEGRFMPASNTKIFTTAVAMWSVASGQFTDAEGAGATVRLELGAHRHTSDVVLAGYGDARLSAADDCVTDCLSTLADAIAANTRRVGNVVGDDTAFPDQRWSPGMSWNNIPSPWGTGVSALTLDDNETRAMVTPGEIGEAPQVTVSEYYTVENHARTIEGDSEAIAYDRMPNSRVLIVTGTIGNDAEPESLRLGIDDPAHYAAWRLAQMLRARGVAVTGEVLSRHRPLLPEDDPALRAGPAARPPRPSALATATPAPLYDDIVTINKVSQNLHADLLLRRVGAIGGTGSIADGQAVVRAMLAEAGVPELMVSLSDGSGMSSYNRVAPRGMVTFLNWIARQPWGAKWTETLPIGGTDGSLRRRFADTPLAGQIHAKTGSLNATNALAGYLTAASGKRYTFAIYANDVPDDVRATQYMDRALTAFAAAH
ncbi:D-alanyl-D-alanine carboxypeptidase/D-alanyl-D-alanine endopeptidase [Tsuneonella suprasediminis]|uniref:D-alanyl-D-alanine carboxypeptidase/D-alanyl-D-alanine endopeptidase n=1 Tax=Tsuneonella suprasediminis TaxID=2306996 RepID=UPI002F95AFAB